MPDKYSQQTVKLLFGTALYCAYPGCRSPLVFKDRGRLTVTAQIAHIRSEKQNGPRYDPEYQGGLNGFGNLLLLCGTHHLPIDRHESEYSINELLIWKAEQVKQADNPLGGDDLAAIQRSLNETIPTSSDSFRVAEIRPLHEATTVGRVEKPTENLLVRGDALHALTSLLELPAYRGRYAGKVKLCYIDPPSNTATASEHYTDALEFSTWLTMLQDRLIQIRHLLNASGTIWLHLDNTEVHRARCVLDAVFGASNYLGTVVWQHRSAKNLASRTIGRTHEPVLVYGASAHAELRTLYLPFSEEHIAQRFHWRDDRGRYCACTLTTSNYLPHLDMGGPWRGFDPSSTRRCWAVPQSPLLETGLTTEKVNQMSTHEKLDALDAAGYIHFPQDGGFPGWKRYASRTKGRPIGDLWTDIDVINSQIAERTGFSTQKPEALIQRILEIGSNKGDLVLDCFAGSGTTAAVAHKLARRWIIVERNSETVAKFTLPRLTKVVQGTDPGGVTKAIGWIGGGGFRVLDIAPSMFEANYKRSRDSCDDASLQRDRSRQAGVGLSASD